MTTPDGAQYRLAPGQVLPSPRFTVRYGTSEGTAALLPTNERGGAWFSHNRDPGFGPLSYSVSAASCVWTAEGHAARFVWNSDTWPGYSLYCECGWSHGNAVWAELRAALISHLTP